jgi:hypothetical protein
MGFGDWLKRRFGKGGRPIEKVPFFDVESGRVVRIPASELRPGAVQARVQGIEGLVWLLPDQLKQGPVQHPPFDEGIRAYIRQIQEAFAEHRALSFNEWEEGFRRDAHPEREIAIWSHAADIYTAFAGNEPSAERRYFGVPALQWIGLTAEPRRARELGVPPFPHMLKWLRD